MTSFGATARLLVICSLLWNAELIAEGGLGPLALVIVAVLCVQLGDAITDRSCCRCAQHDDSAGKRFGYDS